MGSHVLHKSLAKGKWFELPLAEQMGNIGSEVSRASRWRGKDENLFQAAVDRALELFDLTMNDPRWKGRLREIARAREMFCDAVCEGASYGSALDGLQEYFDEFALAARRNL